MAESSDEQREKIEDFDDVTTMLTFLICHSVKCK